MTTIPLNEQDILRAILPEIPSFRNFGIGCIGAGFIMADCHLAAYQQHGLIPTAITSRSREKATSVAARYGIQNVCSSVEEMVSDPRISVIDVAVPPDQQGLVIRNALLSKHHLRGILAQKPLGTSCREAFELVELCRNAGVTLAVNQNMRFDHSIRACRALLTSGCLGDPVLATIEMRAIPHWMPWQQQLGWVTLRIMSIHHLDTFRYWLGEPLRVFASVSPDPRTTQRFQHSDGIALYILEFPGNARATAWDDVWAGPAREGSGADIGIRWRVEGTQGMARGTIGWPDYPERVPSTVDYTTTSDHGLWHSPRWNQVWFPDAFIGPMAELIRAMETGRAPTISGEDNLQTMALVDACYRSAAEHRAVSPAEILQEIHR